jgi:hypothetical protein
MEKLAKHDESDLKAFIKLGQQVSKDSKESDSKTPPSASPNPQEPTPPPKPKPKPGSYDKNYIQRALAASDDYKQSTANGQQFLAFPYMRAYKLRVEGKHGVEELIAFVWDVVNLDVLKFMVEGAKRDMINGIVSYAPNCILVKRYKGAV